MALGTANFYKYTGDPKRANKDLGAVVVSSGVVQPLEPISNLTVRLTVDYKEAAMDCNYVGFDGAYYRITDRERLPAQAMRITARLDSLKTCWAQVANCPAICARSTVKYDSKINDPKYPVIQRKNVFVKKLFDLGNNDIQVLGYIE